MFTRREQTTILVVGIGLAALALFGIVVVAILHGFKAETGALITAWATLVGVVIAQAVAARLAAERAQVDELQAYLTEMGELLTRYSIRDLSSDEYDNVRILARAHTLTVWSGLNQKRRMLVLNYLRETGLTYALGLQGLAGQLEQPASERTKELETNLQTCKQRTNVLQSSLLDANRQIGELRSAIRTADKQLVSVVVPTIDRANQRINSWRQHPRGATEYFVEAQEDFNILTQRWIDDTHSTLARTDANFAHLETLLRAAAANSNDGSVQTTS